jgi:hypothetical protein
VFAGVIEVLYGSPFISGRFPVSLESARVRRVGENGERAVGVMGCEETKYGEW